MSEDLVFGDRFDSGYRLQGLYAGLFTHGGVLDADRWARFSDFS